MDRLVVAVPDLHQPGRRTQVVDVPVGPGGPREVVAEPGPHTSRAECAPDVDVEAAAELELPEPPDLYRFPGGHLQDQGVGSRPGLH